VIELVDSVDAGADRAAALIGGVVRAAPGATVGFATGATPLGLYRRLAEDRRLDRVDWSGITAVALDEYLGLAPSHPDSFAAYLARHVIQPLGLRRVDLLRGDAPAPDEECRRYEQLLRGTIVELQLLGLGRNGHLAFNEPGSPLDGVTRVVELDTGTRSANSSALRELDDTPARAMTQGVGTILRARRLVVLVFGTDKAEALARALEGPVDPSCPASALQGHPDVTVIADRPAASRLSGTASPSRGSRPPLPD